MEFQYRAINQVGERITGFHSASNERTARRELMERYATVLELRAADDGADPRTRPIKVKPELVVVFFRRLGTLVNSGISWANALEFMVNSTEDARLAEASEHLASLVQQGRSLSSAMRSPRLSRVFDPVTIGMVAMGEQTGQLNPVIDKIADLKERQLQLTKEFISALTYPGVLFCVILALGALFSMILGPGDNGLFAAFGTEMPWPTKVVQQISNMVRHPWIIGIILAILAGFGGLFRYQLRRNDALRLRIHALLLKVPAIGNLIVKVECARILFIMSDSLAVGVPVATALLMAADVCSNDYIKKKLRKVHKDFCDGEDITSALASEQVFPPIVLSMLECGMESGRLDSVLGDASKSFEEDVKLALDSISQIAEPVMLVFAGVMAGFMAIATLLPIIKMVENI